MGHSVARYVCSLAPLTLLTPLASYAPFTGSLTHFAQFLVEQLKFLNMCSRYEVWLCFTGLNAFFIFTRNTPLVVPLLGRQIHSRLRIYQFYHLEHNDPDSNSSDRKFDTKLISILHGYTANQKNVSTLHWISFEKSSKVLQKLTCGGILLSGLKLSNVF